MRKIFSCLTSFGTHAGYLGGQSFRRYQQALSRPKHFKSRNPKCRFPNKGVLPIIGVDVIPTDYHLFYNLQAQAQFVLDQTDDLDKLTRLIDRCKSLYGEGTDGQATKELFGCLAIHINKRLVTAKTVNQAWPSNKKAGFQGFGEGLWVEGAKDSQEVTNLLSFLSTKPSEKLAHKIIGQKTAFSDQEKQKLLLEDKFGNNVADYVSLCIRNQDDKIAFKNDEEFRLALGVPAPVASTQPADWNKERQYKVTLFKVKEDIEHRYKRESY